MNQYPAVFLDRDGTLNVDKGYLYQWSDWEWIDEVPEALKKLKEAGFKLVVVSNQSGVARGLYTVDDVMKLHQKINRQLQEICSTEIDLFCFCPHHPKFGSPCNCRKPAPTMIQKAASELNLDLSKSYMIGDKLLDIEAGQAAGVFSILVRTGYGRNFEKMLPPKVPVTDTLPKAIEFILAKKNPTKV